MSVLDTIDVCKYIAACANKVGISVVWEEDEKPRTDGSTMYLPRISAYEVPKNIVKLKQFVKHETSHIAYSDFGVLETHRPTGLLMFVFNLIEDHRVDWLNDSQYDGDRYNTEAYMQVFAAECDARDTPVSDDMADLMAPLFAWDADVREDMWLKTDVFSKHMSEKGKAVHRKLHGGDYADVLRNIRLIADPVKGSAAAYELAKRIIEEVFDVPAGEMEGACEAEGEGEGDGSEEGDKDGGEEGKGKGEGEGGEDGDDKSEGAGKAKRLQEVDCKGEKMMPYAPHPELKGEGVNAHNYEVGVGKTYLPTPMDSIAVVDYTTGEVRNMPYGGALNEPLSGVEYEITRLASHSAALKNNIRTQLQIISRNRWEYGKKKGKLNNSSLYRVGMKDAKGLNERLFKQQVHSETLDVAVQVLVDASGSMSGDKFYNASAAAIILNEVLSVGLHIPLEILAFTELGPKHTMFVHKSFDRPMSLPQMSRDFAVSANYLADNVDGESLAFGFQRIKVRKEKRKLMIVLSDGSPCGGHTKGSTVVHTRAVIKAIEATPVELLGVGVLYDCSKFYTKSAYIPSANKIEEALLSIISNNIIRSV